MPRYIMWIEHSRCGGWFWLSPGGRVSLCVNYDTEDFHLAVASNAETREVREGLAMAESLCLSLLDFELEEPVLTGSGAVVQYLTSVRWLSSFEVERSSA